MVLSLPCVHIHLSSDQDISDRQNIFIKLHCVCVPFIRRSLHFFGESFLSFPIVVSTLNLIFLVGRAMCKTIKCDHRCVPTPEGAVCICQLGYFMANNKSCVGMYQFDMCC